MDQQVVKQTLDTIIAQITGYKNPYSIEDFMEKFAFDVRLPMQVQDSTTGEPTWAQSINPAKFITMSNARKRVEQDDFMLQKRPLNSIEDVLTAWNEVNYVSTERQIDSEHILESDNVYGCQFIYRSQDVHRSKYLLLCDSVNDSEYTAASQRSAFLNYCVRTEDSRECSSSFNVSWSGKIGNSIFIHDCYDVYDSIFCSHISGKKYCVANMQFEEEEYKRIRTMVVEWLLQQ